ncbi:MAG: ExbD/TolR family protein, partial [Planctomycetota bacterium]
MRRRAGLLLPLIPAAVAWVGAASGDKELLFLAGTAALLAGGFAVARPGARVWRVAVVTLSFATVPAAAAVSLGKLAERRPDPPSGGWFVRSFPTASTARAYRVRGKGRLFFRIIRAGIGCPMTLRDLEREMRPPERPVHLLADRDVPWRHVGLVLGLASRAGREHVWLAVRRPDDEWPLYWLPVLLAAHPSGSTVQIEPSAFETVTLGWRNREVRCATEASFRFRERETRSVAELGRWFREDRPGRIEADDAAPYWAVVAVIDQLRL